MALKISIYLPEEIEFCLEAMRLKRYKITSMSSIINEMIWDGLPSEEKLRIRRMRNRQKEDLSDD